MKLKFNIVAGACMAVCSISSFATTALACDPSAADKFVNTCTPDHVLYIAGSSALGGAVSVVAPADLFDGTKPLVTVNDNGSPNGTTGAKAVTAWYGTSKLDGKRLFVVYNNNNGSAAGVSQLLSDATKSGFIEVDVVTVGPTKNVANSCTLVTGSTTAVNCTSHAPTQATVAISDVAPAELYKLYAVKGKLSSLTIAPLALQGFGVAVNPVMYAALQARDIAAGVLATGCQGDMTLACQPNVKRAEYASLVSKVGSIKSAAGFFGSADTTPLTLARRDDLSGTQASSNIFFADNACGMDDAKGDFAKKGGLLGGLAVIDSTMPFPGLTVQANSTTGAVKSALNATSGYAIGVLTLNTSPSSTDVWKFVKLDGVSPNTDPKQRVAVSSGAYPFAMTSYAAWVTKAPKDTALTGLIAAVVAGLKDSTLHDLKGISYLDGAVDTTTDFQQSLVHRTAGNNCSPLVF